MTVIVADEAPRVSSKYIKSRIKDVSYTRVHETVTICSIKLDNGYSVLGSSACVSASLFDEETGQKMAYDKAYGKLWPLFGFALAEQIHYESL